MDEIAGLLCGFLLALAVVTILGHGMWLLLAALFRSGSPEDLPTWKDDLQPTLRLLARLHASGRLDEGTHQRLIAQLRAYEDQMRYGPAEARRAAPIATRASAPAVAPPVRPQPPAAPPAATPPFAAPPAAAPSRPIAAAAPMAAAAPPPVPESAEPLDAIIVEESFEPPHVSPPLPAARPALATAATVPPHPPRPAAAVHPLDRDYVAQPTPPSAARRALADVMQAFMAEKNIRWGELISGLLIVGSAVGLVISLRSALNETVPYFPALIFMLITLAIYGAGMYTLHRWNLRATSRGVLIIALLLSPLNFVAAITLSGPVARPVTDPAFLLAVAVGMAVCSWITFSAGRALVGGGWWRLTVVVLATSLGQVIVDRLMQPEPALTWTAILMALPLGGFLIATLSQLRRASAWQRLSLRRAEPLFIVLGVAVFALLPPLALFVSHADRLRAAMSCLSPVLSVVGGVILATGLLVHVRTHARALAATRTVGTSLAVFGGTLLLMALVLAWPRADLLIVVGGVNFLALVALAVIGRLAILHLAAAACLSVAALVGFHVWQGNVLLDVPPAGTELAGWLLAGRSGIVLSLLAVLSCVAAWLWNRGRRREESLAYLAAAGGLGVASLVVAGWAGFGPTEDTNLATPLFAFYAVAALVAAVGLARWAPEKSLRSEPVRLGGIPLGSQDALVRGLALVASALGLTALVHAAWVNSVTAEWLADRSLIPFGPWAAALLAHGVVGAVVGLVLSGRQLRLSVDQRSDGVSRCLVPLLLFASLATALAAAVVAVCHPGGGWLAVALYLAGAAGSWLIAAGIRRDPVVWSVFQALGTLALVYAVAGSSERWQPLRGELAWQQYLQVLAVVLAGWCLAWTLLRRLTPHRPNLQAVLRSSWPPVDEVVASGLVLVVAGLALAAAWPGLAWETTAQRVDWTAAAPALTWLALAAVAAAVLVWLGERAAIEPLLGLLVLGAAAVLLLASGAADATATAARWWAAGYTVFTAACVWGREPLMHGARRARLWGQGELPAHAAAVVRQTALLLGGGIILVITTIVAGRTAAGLQIGAAGADSLLGGLNPTVSYAVPLLALIVVLLGHAVRERRGEFALAGSLVLQYVVSLAYLLQADPQTAGFGAGLLQWNAAAAAAYCLVWLAVQQRISPVGQRLDERGELLLGGQLVAAWLVLAALCAWAGLAVVYQPQAPSAAVQPLGEWLSYVAWLATAVAALWYRRLSPARWMQWASPVGGAAVGGWMLVALLAVSVDRWDASREWLSYHVLTYGGLVMAAALTAVGWRWPGAWRAAAWSGVAVYLLAVRGGWSDAHPLAPWWSVLACLTVAVQAGVFSLRGRSQPWAYAAAVAGVTAMTLSWLSPGQGLWQRDPEQAVFELITSDAAALLIAALIWLAAELWWQHRAGALGLDERFGGPRLHAAASVTTLVVLSLLLPPIVLINSLDRGSGGRGDAVDLTGGGTWLAVVLLGVALAGAVWDRRARYTVAGLYAWGLLLIGLLLDRFQLAPQVLLTAITAIAAAYMMLTGWLWRQGAVLANWGANWGVPDPLAGLKRTAAWLPVVNLLMAAGAALLALVLVSFFPQRELRYVAAAVPVMLAIGTAALAQQQRRAAMQFLAVLLIGLAGVYLGWADLAPVWRGQAFLLRAFRLLMVASLLTFACGVLVPRWLAASNSWATAVRRAAGVFGGTGMLSLVGVLALEAMLFLGGGVQVAGVYVAAVAIVLSALVAGLIGLALQRAPGPLPLSETGRMAYVYAAEAVAGLLFVHLYLCRPEWFGGMLRPYWPYIVMAVAFAGVAVGELFQRSGIRVLAEPLQRTGAFLPLLPVVGWWVIAAPGTDYSLLLLGVGVVYVLVSMLRRSAASLVAAVVAGNGALWSLLHDSGFSMAEHPQFWLIPPAISVLIAGQLNQRRLSAEQLTGLRYACGLVIYISSTSELFIRGVGQSLWPPMILAALSVAGVLLGMVLRVRAFLYLGSSFVLLSVVSMVWHASRAIGHVWPWWAFGIGLGLSILALFGVFEKKRPEITLWVETLRRWES